MPTQQIKDEYEIVAEIGEGGMATVYKAIQKSLDRPVAIKELKRAYHADSQTVKRFERESKVAASLQHENIVHIYDYWKRPSFCIVMEYVDGVNLADVIPAILQKPAPPNPNDPQRKNAASAVGIQPSRRIYTPPSGKAMLV